MSNSLLIQEGEKSFQRGVEGLFSEKERLTPSQWLERFITLPHNANETKPGSIEWDDAPYLPGVIDELQNPETTDIVFVAPTRTGKTFLIKCGIAYSIAGDPAPHMLVDSTVEKGKGLVKKEIRPLVERNRVLREKKPRDENDYSLGLMLFRGANFNVFGANSDAQVSGETVKRVFGNETDKWREGTETEASIIEQTRHRTESFEGERKHMYSSTPTLTTRGIWLEYLKTDQCKWFNRCKHCGELSTFEWINVNFGPPEKIYDAQGNYIYEAILDLATYVCPTCKEHWDDAQRLWAVRNGLWQSTAKGLPGYKGFHVVGPHGALKKNSIGALVVDFLSAKGTGFLKDRRDFWNSRWGMPYIEDAIEFKEHQLDRFKGEFERGKLPEGFKPDVLIIGVDVQRFNIPWLLEAYKWNGDHVLIDHGEAGSLNDLLEVQKEYSEYAKVYGIVDVQYKERRNEVFDFLYNNQKQRWYGVSSVERMSEMIKLEKHNAYIGGKEQKQRLKYPHIVISSYDFKLEIEKRFTGEIDNWKIYKLPNSPSPQEVKERRQLCKELTDEKKVRREKRRKSDPEFEFIPKTKQNHRFDCKVYAMALFYALVKHKTFKARKNVRRKPSVNIQRGN